jgi:predicted MFS family arabinose efflux permease
MLEANPPTRRTLFGLDWLNFFLADVLTGVGAFLAIYLADYRWNARRIGFVLTVGGIAGILTQTPAGALVDRLRAKRALIALGVIALVIGAMATALFPKFWSILCAQILIGATSTVFIPCICAISLGIVGPKRFDSRQGRNQTFNSAGNVFAALMMGLVGYFISTRAAFFFVAASAVPTLIFLRLIRPEEIDYSMARGGTVAAEAGRPPIFKLLCRDKALVTFLACAVMFHFANAAMLPLLGEMLSKGKGRSSMMFMAACVLTTQIVITLIASPIGSLAASLGRKPLLLIGFGVLPIRGFFYTLTNSPMLLVAIQILDGVGAGIFGVVSVLVIADLTRGTGRFNLAQGAIATAIGVGASLSQVIDGGIVFKAGYDAAFRVLAGIAAVALVVLWRLMPETREDSEHRADSAPPGAGQAVQRSGT